MYLLRLLLLNKYVMIINTNFYHIDGTELSLRNFSAYTALSLWEDHPYLHIQFKSSLERLHDAITHAQLHSLRTGSLHLILCNSHESFHHVVTEIYTRAVDELNIPEHKILLLSESADILDEVKQVATALGKKEIRVNWARIFEFRAKDYIPTITPDDMLSDKKYDKAYLNFNRRTRLHRPTLVALLVARQLISAGHVSIAPEDSDSTWAIEWYKIQNTHTSSVLDILLPFKDSIINLSPMYLDTTELETTKICLELSTEYLYASTYFSVVSETNFYKEPQPGRLLSEKTFKPIIMGHPFILVARPRSLELLTELGYRTFSPWIDERYDGEVDDEKRLLMILAEIERLVNLSSDELSEFLHNVRQICSHNQQVVRSKQICMTALN